MPARILEYIHMITAREYRESIRPDIVAGVIIARDNYLSEVEKCRKQYTSIGRSSTSLNDYEYCCIRASSSLIGILRSHVRKHPQEANNIIRIINETRDHCEERAETDIRIMRMYGSYMSNMYMTDYAIERKHQAYISFPRKFMACLDAYYDL